MKKFSTFLILILAAAAGSFAESYSLELYIKRVSENSRDLNLSRREIEIAELSVKQAKSSLFPRISAQAGYARNFLDLEQSYPYAADPDNPMSSGLLPLKYTDYDINSDNDFSFGLSADQVIFDMRAYDALKYGQEYEKITRTGFQEASRNILSTAKKLYYQTVLLREIKAVKESSEKNDKAAYIDIKRKYEAGLIQELEVLRAEVTWKSKIAEVSQARKDLEIALIQLKSLAGIGLEEPFTLTDDFSSYPELPEEKTLTEVLSKRPDYELLMRRKRMAEISLDLAYDEHYPSVTARLGYTRAYSSDKVEFKDPTDLLQLGVQVSLPIYSGGATSSKVDSGKIEIEKKDIEVAKLRDSVATELRQINLTLREARERIDSAKALRETAERAYSLAKVSMDSGILTVLELNDSAVQREGAHLQYNIAVFDYLLAYFDWEKASGSLR